MGILLREIFIWIIEQINFGEFDDEFTTVVVCVGMSFNCCLSTL